MILSFLVISKRDSHLSTGPGIFFEVLSIDSGRTTRRIHINIPGKTNLRFLPGRPWNLSHSFSWRIFILKNFPPKIHGHVCEHVRVYLVSLSSALLRSSICPLREPHLHYVFLSLMGTPPHTHTHIRNIFYSLKNVWNESFFWVRTCEPPPSKIVLPHLKDSHCHRLAFLPTIHYMTQFCVLPALVLCLPAYDTYHTFTPTESAGGVIESYHRDRITQVVRHRLHGRFYNRLLLFPAVS